MIVKYKNKNNKLEEVGYKVFLDRYAEKDIKKETLVYGDIVLFTIPGTTQKEIGKVTTLPNDRGISWIKSLGEEPKTFAVHKDCFEKPLELNPEKMMDRMAIAQANFEAGSNDTTFLKYVKDFRWLLDEYKFVPGGRISAMLGTKQQDTLTSYNCFILASPNDSMDGIIKTLGEQAECMRRGGGVGFNLSTLRPLNSIVSKVNGRSSGATSFADLYSFVTNLIQQGGSRRGALMLMLNDWHPDLLDFIVAKKNMQKITFANVSIALSDAFMKAVEDDSNWDLKFPDTSSPEYEKWNGILEKYKGPVIVHKTMKAREIWNLIIDSAWSSGEPGLWFRDRCNFWSNSFYYDSGYLIATNPCLAQGSLIATPNGNIPVENIKIGDKITTVFGEGEVSNIEVHENYPTYKVKLSDGSEQICTAAHKFHAFKQTPKINGHRKVIKKFEEISLENLDIGDWVRIHPHQMPNNKVNDNIYDISDVKYGFILGCLLGDGCYTESNLNRNSVSISYDKRESDWKNILVKSFSNFGNPNIEESDSHNSGVLKWQSKNGLSALIKNSKLSISKAIDKYIPIEYINSNKDFLAGLVDGLFSTDGNVNLKAQSPQIRFDSASKKLVNNLRLVLLSFGIHSRIYSMHRKPHAINGREIKNDNKKYTLYVYGEGVNKFIDQIGISHPDKAKKLEEIKKYWSPTGNTWKASIVSIEKHENTTVYDLYEHKSDTWISEGVVQQGCGEIPNPADSVCNLGHINLSKFYFDAENVEAGNEMYQNIDWDKLSKTVSLAVRFLDNVIDITNYFNPSIEKQQKSERRIGLGTMGLAELLIKCKIRYGSDEALDFCDHLYNTIKLMAYDASAKLAKEKGAFPNFTKEMLQSNFVKTIHSKFPDDKEVQNREYRNVVLLTQAPTGSGATYVNTSSGIEPFYAWKFYRTSRLGRFEENVKIYQEWLDDNSGEKLPDYYVTAMELKPEEHVRMQATIQQHVDQSISKTCNLPENYTREQVGAIYKLMYELGCKGGTVYRDNSRNFQVLSTEKDSANFADDLAGIKTEPKFSGNTVTVNLNANIEEFKAGLAEAEKVIKVFKENVEPKKEVDRYKGPLKDVPTIREGKTVSIETPAGTAHITLNSVDGNPVEVFAGLGKGGSDINSMAEALGRLISVILRLDGRATTQERVNLIIDQLDGISGPRSYGFGRNAVSGLPDAIGKALKMIWEKDILKETEALDKYPELGVTHENTVEVDKYISSGDLCPGCGFPTLRRTDGCKKCDCGYSEC